MPTLCFFRNFDAPLCSKESLDCYLKMICLLFMPNPLVPSGLWRNLSLWASPRHSANLILFAVLSALPLALSAQDEAAAPAAAEVAETIADAPADVEPEAAPANALVEKLRGSGKTGIALFLVSVIGFSFAFERLFNLRKSLVAPDGLAGQADKLWKEGNLSGVKELASKQPSTLGRVILALADHKDASHADVSMIAGDVASREMRYHGLKAYPLAVVATISPLLGLFGTVYGMIGAFESVALAGEMGDPSIMAGDISYALITTALGLIIAVPALAAYHYFRIRTRLLALALEEQSGHLISRWFGPEARKTDNEGEA
jgi:biopolymer transport protein ExbB